MRRFAVACVVLAGLAAASPAIATTQTAQSGTVSAAFTFSGSAPSYHGETLSITRAGTVAYDAPVNSSFCGTACWPLSTSSSRSSVHVVDLGHTGDPEVVLDLYSGGAHCCTIEQVFSFDAATSSYSETERDFGDPGDRIFDLGHNGRFEFLTADDSFAYAFTDFAASGLPIQILAFSKGQFENVTKSYPAAISRDAAGWLKAYRSTAHFGYQDSVGVIAAWAADEDLLGHKRHVAQFLSSEAKAGHLNSALGGEPRGRRFVAALTRFLRRHHYTS